MPALCGNVAVLLQTHVVTESLTRELRSVARWLAGSLAVLAVLGRPGPTGALQQVDCEAARHGKV